MNQIVRSVQTPIPRVGSKVLLCLPEESNNYLDKVLPKSLQMVIERHIDNIGENDIRGHAFHIQEELYVIYTIPHSEQEGFSYEVLDRGTEYHET